MDPITTISRAVVLLGIWFLMQLLSAGSGGGAGVAWWAHVGGFVVGILLVRAFAVRLRPRSTRTTLHRVE